MGFQTYIYIVIILSLLLSFAGIQTTAGYFLGKFMTVTPPSPTTNMTVNTGFFHGGIGGSIFIIGLLALMAVYVGASGVRAFLGGTQGIAETLKVSVGVLLIPWILVDLVNIITYLNSIDSLGGSLKVIIFLIYIPISIGAIFGALDWIGGGK